MKKISGRYISLIVVGVIFVIWNVLVWTLAKLEDANVYFYCGYAFTAIAFLLVAGVLFLFRLGKNTIFSVMMPAYIATGLYFFVTLIMNMIFMINTAGDNTKAVVIPNVIIVLLYLAAMAVAYFAVSHIHSNNEVIDQKVATLKRVSVDLGQIGALATDPDIKTALSKLREAVDYSDPMGNAETASLEEEFTKKVAEVRMLVENNYEKDLVLGKITAADNKLRERNEYLRTTK